MPKTARNDENHSFVEFFLGFSSSFRSFVNLKAIYKKFMFLFSSSFFSGVDYQCSKIDYFPKDEYSPDPNDSTMAIPCKSSILLVFIIQLISGKFSMKNNLLSILTGRALTKNAFSQLHNS